MKTYRLKMIQELNCSLRELNERICSKFLRCRRSIAYETDAGDSRVKSVEVIE